MVDGRASVGGRNKKKIVYGIFFDRREYVYSTEYSIHVHIIVCMYL